MKTRDQSPYRTPQPPASGRRKLVDRLVAGLTSALLLLIAAFVVACVTSLLFSSTFLMSLGLL